MDFDKVKLLAAYRTTICFLRPLFQAHIVQDMSTSLYNSNELLGVGIVGMSGGGKKTPKVIIDDNLRSIDDSLGGCNIDVQIVQTDNTLISHADMEQ